MSATPVPGPEIRLFDTPDLATLQRNWPRIALRAGALTLIPLTVALLARALDLYDTIRAIPLPLDFLDVGPFAYEAKIIFTLAAAILALGFLMPQRTAQIVLGVCTGGVLYTGHVHITLQWARLFAPEFAFRNDSAPTAAAWILAGTVLALGAAFVLIDALLDTARQQRERGLGDDDTRALQHIAARAALLASGLGLAFIVTLAAGYALLRALTDGRAVPFRMNPVYVLFVAGIALAVLVALAARRRDPVAPRE